MKAMKSLGHSFGIIFAVAGFAATAALAQVKQEQPVSALKGHNSNAPVDVTAQRIEVQDRADRAIFAGNVHATQAELTLLAAQLNESLGSRGGDEARRRYEGAPLGLEKELLGRVIAVLDLYEKGSESLVVHDGVRNLLRQPEFAESSRVHQVLEVLEETRYLTVLLRQLIGESDLQIVIGSENASSGLQGCAVVLTTYGPTDRLKGVLGVIGPTRMAYSQTVARLQAVARGASDRMAELGV